MADDLAALAKNAYIFGYPLVYNLTEVTNQTTAPKVTSSAPVNLFGHARELAGPADEFVSLNTDTLYTFVHCDVTDEPLVLHLPDTHDRYFVMQFVDAWTNNFAYVGRRASGTKEAAYLLSGPSWTGEIPDGLEQITAPTNVFSIIGRYAVNGAADQPNVAALQDQTWVTPLSRFPQLPERDGRHFGDWDVAPWNRDVPENLQFWEKLRSWMQRFPPPAGDQPFVESLKPLGLLETESPYVDADPALAEVLQTGAEEGQAEIEAVTRKGSVEPVNGWVSAMHAFDYNLDNFGPGTIDSPQWKLPSRQVAYVVRAASARGGLWGNHGYEAVYSFIYVDERDEQLTGDRRYRLHFDKTPPVDAFWSMTMYNVPKFYLVDNPIDRYSIGDRTPGLRYNDDGSLDIFIQRERPDDAQLSNWLPAPDGDFRPLMRMYQPQAAILDGTYQLPAIERID